jgi:two-component system, OmpR family, response regulator RegX3
MTSRSLGRDCRLSSFPGSTRRDATDTASLVPCEAGSVNSAHAPVIPCPGELPGQARHPRGHKLAWLLEHRAQILASIAVSPPRLNQMHEAVVNSVLIVPCEDRERVTLSPSRASHFCKFSDWGDRAFMVGGDSDRVPGRDSAPMSYDIEASQARAGATGLSVLLVEDEQSIAEPFARALTRSGFLTTVARTAAEAIELMETVDPDVVLLDLALPDGDGRDVCRRLRRDSDVPIIIVTASGTVTDRVVGLELGADDYVVKPFAIAEVIARIRAVLRRGRTNTADRGELAVQDLRIDTGARRVWLRNTELELARKEFDLLVRLAQDAGRVVSRETLMSDVWDMNWFGSTKTLDVHIAWLRRKLGDDPANPIYVHTVRGVGFRLAAEQEFRP